MKQLSEREWFWCSDCNGKEDRKQICKDCYLRFPEKEVEKEISRVNRST